MFLELGQKVVQLATWVNDQRWKYRKGNLSSNRIKRLNHIGFVWELHKTNWEEMFEALNEYKENHGDCNVPYDWVENNLRLGIWVTEQRK